MKKKKIFSLLLFLLGLFFLAYPYIAHNVNDHAMQQQIEEFETVSAQPVPQEEQSDVWNDMIEYNEQLVNNQGGSVQDVFTDEVMASNAFYENENTEEENSALQANESSTPSPQFNQSASSSTSSTFYSIIRIPKINIELPIYLGASDANLLKGAAHVNGTSLPVGGKSTHSLIAGHRGTLNHNMFLHINKLTKGDTFEIQTLDKTMTYRVTGTKIVLPDEVDSLSIQKDKDLVTLVTCLKYPMNYKRLLVYGERAD